LAEYFFAEIEFYKIDPWSAWASWRAPRSWSSWRTWSTAGSPGDVSTSTPYSGEKFDPVSDNEIIKKSGGANSIKIFSFLKALLSGVQLTKCGIHMIGKFGQRKIHFCYFFFKEQLSDTLARFDLITHNSEGRDTTTRPGHHGKDALTH
jgi:hypothetical protein